MYIYPSPTALGIGKFNNTLFFGAVTGLKKSTPTNSGGSPNLPAPITCTGTPPHATGHDNITQAGQDIFVTNASFLPYAYNPVMDSITTVTPPATYSTMQPAFSVMFDGSLWTAGGTLDNILIKSVKNAPLDFNGI